MMTSFMNLTWKWEYICGPAGLHPWDDSTKDFGTCFQELFLQIPIYFILAISSAYYIGYRKNWVVREKTQERAITLRSLAVLGLMCIPIIKIYIYLTDKDLNLFPINYFSAGAASLSWLVHFGYILALKHRLGQSARGPLCQLVLWAILVFLNIIALRSTNITGGINTFNIAAVCCHAIYFFTLLPSSDSRPTFYSPCLVGSQHSHSEYTPLLPHGDEGILGTAMQGSSCWSRLTFSWVDPLLQKGFENKLQDPEELHDIPARYRCSYVGARMDRALIGNVDNYQQFAEVPHEPFIGSGYGATGETQPQTSTPVTPTSRILLRPERRQNVSLLRALHHCFALQFYGIGIFKLISDMAGFAGPMLLNKLISFVEDDSIDQHFGYIYAATLLGATIIAALFNVHFNWAMSIIGLKMRGAIVSTILRKTLSVTSTELSRAFSVGEITNFMSTDTDRIINSCPSFHSLWSIPLQLVITLLLLYQQVGVSFLAGVGFSVILIPINKFVANKIGELSTEMMKHKDSRVSLISDMLRGIRTVKVHVWEDYFINRVSEARRMELKYLRGRKYLDAVCVVLWATTPVLVAALTLGTHALRAQPLDAPTVFTTVALINMLIAPLNAFPWVLNGLTEAWVSIKRIQKLLDLKDMDIEQYYDRLNTNRDEDKIIILKKASFSWYKPSLRRQVPSKMKKDKGKSKKKISKRVHRRDSISSSESPSQEPFSLKDISLEIGKEELVCVAGPVASGKTSLLLALIGEMRKQSGDIQIPENLNSFGYVSQQPWLIRGTIRDNILFGKPYDEAKFKSVIDVCALTEDLNVLGWNAYVGDAGCTLSGGQRARIALARAVYQDKQVYLLDDVLSGLDARVAAHVLQRCVLGALRHTARVLVAHAPAHLARAHRVLLLRDGRLHAQGTPDIVLNEIEDFLPSETDSIGEERQLDVIEPKNDESDNISRNSLDNDETMSEGTVGWWVIGLYLRSVGAFLTMTIIISIILMQVSQNFTFIWLTFWVKNQAKNSTALQMIDNVHENTTVLDHGISIADNIVHTIVNKSMEVINMVTGKNFTDNVIPAGGTDYISVKPELRIPLNSDSYYLEVYFGLAGLNLVFTIMRAFLFAYGGVKAAAKIHRALLNVIVKANIKFFDVTPIGRIVNRFSSDTYTVDDSLPFIMNILLAQLFSLIGAVVVTVYGLPWLLVGVLPMTFIYYRLQRRYRVTSRQLKRLQSVALSPVYVHFNDTLEGLSTVRALGAGGRWAERGEEGVERWQRAALCAAAAAQWLALRLQAGAAATTAAAALLAVLQRATHAADPGLVGLAISYALSMTSMLSNVLNAFTETEREMIAVERVGEYIREVESEKIDGDSPPYGWPSHGVISFEDVHLQYGSGGGPGALRGLSLACHPSEHVAVVGRTGAGKSSLLRAVLRLAPARAGAVRVDGVDVAALHLHALSSGGGPGALRGLSLACHPSEHVAVVGRTGAGKSSLLRAVLRLAPARAGAVRVDGVDVAALHLHALRSRIGMIPQEPFIFTGTIMENIDPLEQYLEAEIWRALDACGARAVVESRGGLQGPVLPLARGHAQLLCLVRALLHKPKILLVDEATANLDADTERTILNTMRTAFGASTVLFVAHRLTGAVECARVAVLGAGRLLELRAPHDALADPESHLYKLVHADRPL